MKISNIGSVGQYVGSNESVMDYRPIPGQMSGFGEFEEAESNAMVADYNRIPGELNGMSPDDLAQLEDEAILYGDVGLGASFGETLAYALTDDARRKMMTPEFQKVQAQLSTMNDIEIKRLNAALTQRQGYKDLRPQEVQKYAPLIKLEFAKRVAAENKFERERAARARAKAGRPAPAAPMRAAPPPAVNEGVLRSIIKTAEDLRVTIRNANALKLEQARKSPLKAVQLRDAMKRKLQPGTNTQTAYTKAMFDAALMARRALFYRSQAAKALAGGDKNKAAEHTIKYMTEGRKAQNLALSAEKTKQAMAADKLAKTAEAQAEFLSNAAKNIVAQRGPTPQADKLRAQAQVAQENANKMKAVAATIAAQPKVAPTAPSEKKIASLANKYNIRMAGKGGSSRALLTVLDGFAEDALAQADDYEAALSYYGGDTAGKVMADIEYGNLSGFLHGMAVLDGFGQATAPAAGGEAAAAPASNDPFASIFGALKSTGDAIMGAVGLAQKVGKAVDDTGKAFGVKPPPATKPPAVTATKGASAKGGMDAAQSRLTAATAQTAAKGPPKGGSMSMSNKPALGTKQEPSKPPAQQAATQAPSQQAAAASQSPAQQSAVMTSGGGFPVVPVAIAAVVVVGGAAWFFLRKKPAGAVPAAA